MRALGTCALLMLLASASSEAYAQEIELPIDASASDADDWLPLPLSDSQRHGMRWGAQIGIFAGLGAALLIAKHDDCESYECVGDAGSLPLYIGAGMLGGMVVGGAVGLAIGTWVDDEGEARAAMSLTVTLRGP